MKKLSLRSVRLSFQGKTPKPGLSSSSEKHEKKGLTVCDFPEDAYATTENLRFFAHLSAIKRFCSNRGAIHPGLASRGSCHQFDLEGQSRQTVLESVV
jgi:hypothetical protein